MSHPSPIVLVHGIFGFGQLKLSGFGVTDYFRLIPDALRSAGHEVPEPPSLNAAGRIAERPADLKRYLDNHPEVSGRRVHVVAHNMGRLDARFMISTLNRAHTILPPEPLPAPH